MGTNDYREYLSLGILQQERWVCVSGSTHLLPPNGPLHSLPDIYPVRADEQVYFNFVGSHLVNKMSTMGANTQCVVLWIGFIVAEWPPGEMLQTPMALQPSPRARGLAEHHHVGLDPLLGLGRMDWICWTVLLTVINKSIFMRKAHPIFFGGE